MAFMDPPWPSMILHNPFMAVMHGGSLRISGAELVPVRTTGKTSRVQRVLPGDVGVGHAQLLPLVGYRDSRQHTRPLMADVKIEMICLAQFHFLL